MKPEDFEIFGRCFSRNYRWERMNPKKINGITELILSRDEFINRILEENQIKDHSQMYSSLEEIAQKNGIYVSKSRKVLIPMVASYEAEEDKPKTFAIFLSDIPFSQRNLLSSFGHELGHFLLGHFNTPNLSSSYKETEADYFSEKLTKIRGVLPSIVGAIVYTLTNLPNLMGYFLSKTYEKVYLDNLYSELILPQMKQ